MEEEPHHDVRASLRRLSDVELIARIRRLVARERRATALLLAHLAELDTRDAHLRAGYSSLFAYCREGLGLSEHDAYNRIEVSRTARRLPLVLERVASGAVNLTTVRLLGPHLTPENHRGVLESARGKRRTEVEEMVARLAPFPEAPPFVRKLPAPRSAPPPPAGLRLRRAHRRHRSRRCPPVASGLRARSHRWRRNATGCRSRSAVPRSRSCGSPRTC